MNEFSWRTCLWPEDEHPRPLCRHAWERDLRAAHDGQLPVAGGIDEQQWEAMLAMIGEPHCPCEEELRHLKRDHSA